MTGCWIGRPDQVDFTLLFDVEVKGPLPDVCEEDLVCALNILQSERFYESFVEAKAAAPGQAVVVHMADNDYPAKARRVAPTVHIVQSLVARITSGRLLLNYAQGLDVLSEYIPLIRVPSLAHDTALTKFPFS
jgi:hypothetical protein